MRQKRPYDGLFCTMFVAVLRGGHIELILEVLVEVLERVEACHVGYLADVVLAVAQELGGTFETYAAYELQWGHAHDALYLTIVEMAKQAVAGKLAGVQIVKTIVVPKKLVNFVVKQ